MGRRCMAENRPSTAESRKRIAEPAGRPVSSAGPAHVRRNRPPSTGSGASPYWAARPATSLLSTALLGGQRAGERDAAVHPLLQVRVVEDLRVDAEPAVHLPPTHDGRVDVLVDQRWRVLRVDPDQQATLPTGRHRHVPVDEEREPAEHLLLVEPLLRGDQLPNPVGEVEVISHAGDYDSGG